MDSYFEKQADSGGGHNYNEYYANQGGEGIGAFYSGYAYPQRGGGFFGRILKGGILPLLQRILPYLGEKAVDAYQGMVSDYRQGKTIKEVGKRGIRRTAATVARDIAEKLNPQEGSGIRRKRRRRRLPSRPVKIITFKRKAIKPKARKAKKRKSVVTKRKRSSKKRKLNDSDTLW